MAGIERILIVHPDAGTRSAIEQALRRVFTGPAAVYQASSPTQGLQLARGVDPSVVLLDLTADRALALQVARELRRPGRREVR